MSNPNEYMRRKVDIGNDWALQIESSMSATPASQKSMDTATVFLPVKRIITPSKGFLVKQC
ncbi:hypothetical protein BT96DRAFT_917655 [Gymnopus androsaceus JB14]|uniref:Uncharacterized protein n=1 Tax=Gymnopus androsaceus JB14 TaxID=1447944 RepID=A0A6A4I2V9_9AGAR|nr:hypothetical protein BT96DRAFT_917655 [Gymnopus androsaceus JB14]